MTTLNSTENVPQHDQQQAINALTADWLAAEKAKNIEHLLTLVTDDVVFLPSRVPVIRGKPAIAAMYRTYFSDYEIEHHASNEEIQVSGEWAYAWGSEELLLRPVSGDPEIRLTGKGMTILRRCADGLWRFARGINNLMPDMPSPKT
jgi:uncharacterized protein (TIGR02246 family)